MLRAAARPICLAAGDTPGTAVGSLPWVWLWALARSPTTLMAGWPGRARSGSTFTRPARSVSAPAAVANKRPSGEAATPAAQMMHLLSIRELLASVPSAMEAVLTINPSASIAVTLAPSRTCTPSFSSCWRARSLSVGGIACSTRGPASTSSTWALDGSMRRNSPGRVWRAISASVPAISTPVGPAPITTKVSQAARRVGSLSFSADSKASSTRRRISNASSSVFRPGACGAQSSWPK